MKIEINHELIESYMRINGYDETLLAKKCCITQRQAHLFATATKMHGSLSLLLKFSVATDLGTSYLTYLEPTTKLEILFFEIMKRNMR